MMNIPARCVALTIGIAATLPMLYNKPAMGQQYDPDRHHRHSIRLPGWDYRAQAYYFVTICAHQRSNTFDTPALADIARNGWQRIPDQPHARGVILDEWILMPNHLHGILLLPGPSTDVDPDAEAVMPGMPFDMRFARALNQPPGSLDPEKRPRLTAGSLGAIIGNYKSGVARRINAVQRTPGNPVWQRGYFERVIRNNHELDRIRVYIRDNPDRWAADRDDLDALLRRMNRIQS
jgi:putative transposase